MRETRKKRVPLYLNVWGINISKHHQDSTHSKVVSLGYPTLALPVNPLCGLLFASLPLLYLGVVAGEEDGGDFVVLILPLKYFWAGIDLAT